MDLLTGKIRPIYLKYLVAASGSAMVASIFGSGSVAVIAIFLIGAVCVGWYIVYKKKRQSVAGDQNADES
jgi:ABC-type amino acid transport system permease subunit